jgi:hypothetical protein
MISSEQFDPQSSIINPQSSIINGSSISNLKSPDARIIEIPMKRLDQAAIAALKSILETQPTNEAKVSFAWTIAAGPTLARAATVTWSETGTLRVVARTEAWRQELSRARPLIARRIADLVGEDVVRRIAIDVVRDERLVSNVVPPSRR